MVTERQRGFFDFGRTTWKVLAICALVTYVFGIAVRTNMYENKAAGAIFSVYVDTLVILAALPLIAVIVRSKLSRLNFFTIGLTVATSTLCATVILGIVYLTTYFLPVFTNTIQNNPFLLIAYFTIIMSIWVLAAFSVKIYTLANEQAIRVTEAAHAATASELRRLRMQLDPHFLFNAMNTAVVEIPHRPKRAALMLRELSNYLRYSLEMADVQLVPVSIELSMIRSFLRVQDIRFGAKVKHSITAREDAKRRMVPAFLLQPLVENAAKFGLPDDENILRIDIAVTLQDDDLVITVSNTGELALSDPANRGTGTGLSNLRSRLALHYPERHSFDMTQVGGSVRVICTLRGAPNT